MKKWNMTDGHKEAAAQWNWRDACLLITDEMIRINIRWLQSRVQVSSMLRTLWKSNRSISKILFRYTNLLIEKKDPGNKATFCAVCIRGTLRQCHIYGISLYSRMVLMMKSFKWSFISSVISLSTTSLNPRTFYSFII